MTRTEITDLLRFWERLKDKTYPPGPDKDAWKADLRTRIEAVSDGSLPSFTDIKRRRYEEQEATRGSASTRGGALFVFIGLLTTGATIVAGSVTGAWLLWQVLIIIVGSLLLIAAFAAAWLAVRSQQVTTWEVPKVDPAAAVDERALNLTYAVEVMAAVEQNSKTLNNIVGYLRDAQRWALIALALVAVLAPLSVIAAATKAPTNDATIGPAAGATFAAMTPLESLLIAFVGGGLAGALVTGLFALIVESRRHAYQDRTRFIDLKRERFATLLREADEHVRILMRQRAFVQDANRKGIRPENEPSLGPTDEMSHPAAEIWLLGQKKDVGQAATEMYAAVVALDAFAWDADSVDVNEWIRSSSEALTANIAKFEAARERFLEAAKVDLGTG